MAARGVGRGDPVMTLVGSRIEWVLAMLACFRMGAVAMPCNPQLRRKTWRSAWTRRRRSSASARRICSASCPRGVPAMTMADVADALDEDRPQETPAIADLDPDDPAVIIFTSGTTGDPRGVVYPQRYLLGQALQAEHWVGARPGDLAWCTAAPGWSKSTRNTFIAPWLAGAAALIHDARFDPAERLDLVEREGVNVLCQAPTEYRILAKRAELRAIPSLRRMISAGEPLNPEVIRVFREQLGSGIGDGYGQTETGPVTGMRPDEDDPARDGSMGRPLPGIEVQVVEGELQIRPGTVPTFFSHYIGEQPFEGEWWSTGDHVRQDEDGYLWFEGRDDDIIITAGYRVGPVRGRVRARLPSGGGRGRRGPGAGRGARLRRPRDRGARERRALGPARRRAPGPRQAGDGARTSTRASSSSRTSCRRPPSGKIRRAELR